MAGNNAQDQKDYQDYLDYQKHTAGKAGSQTHTNALGSTNDPSQGGSLLDSALRGLAGSAEPLPQDPGARQQYTAAQGQAGRLAAGVASAPFSLPVQAAVGAGVGATEPANSMAERGINTLIGGVAPVAIGKAAEGVDKLGDWLAQKSVGMRKYVSGMGTRLLDQGIWGTRAGMTSATRAALPGAEQAVQDSAKGITQVFSPDTFADAVAAKAGRFITPDSGDSLNPQNLQKVQDYADHLRAMGTDTGESVADVANPRQLSASDVLGLKRQADEAAYAASGNKGTSLEADLAKTTGDTARAQLSQASGGATHEALANERALLLANQGLTRQPTIRQGPPMSSLLGMLAGGMTGSTPYEHGRNAAIGFTGGQVMRSPLLLSTLAKGAAASSGAASAAGPVVAPALYDLLYGNSSNNGNQR